MCNLEASDRELNSESGVLSSILNYCQEFSSGTLHDKVANFLVTFNVGASIEKAWGKRPDMNSLELW